MRGALNQVNRVNCSQETSIFLCTVALMAEADVEVVLYQDNILGANLYETFNRHTIPLGKYLDQTRCLSFHLPSANSHNQAALLSVLFFSTCYGSGNMTLLDL